MADIINIVAPVSEINEPTIKSDTTALEEEAFRGSWAIQNLGTNTLYVKLGDGASTTSFHFALKAGSVNDDGTGGSVSQSEGVVFNGKITVAGVSPRYTLMNL
jgi:hypothetical protein